LSQFNVPNQEVAKTPNIIIPMPRARSSIVLFIEPSIEGRCEKPGNKRKQPKRSNKASAAVPFCVAVVPGMVRKGCDGGHTTLLRLIQ
jgi:hypothetical protein